MIPQALKEHVQSVVSTPHLKNWHFRQLLRLNVPAHKPGQEREQRSASHESETSGDIAVPSRAVTIPFSSARKPELEAIDEESSRNAAPEHLVPQEADCDVVSLTRGAGESSASATSAATESTGVRTSVALSAASQPSVAGSSTQQQIDPEPASVGIAGNQKSPCREAGDHSLSTSGLPADHPNLDTANISPGKSHSPMTPPSSTMSRLYELQKGVFTAPQMAVPTEHLKTWKTLRWRLDDTLRNLFKPEPGLDPSISLDMAMTGPSFSHMRPSIIIFCCNVPHQKQIQRILKSQDWISPSDYEWLVLVDQFQMLAPIQVRHDQQSSSSHFKRQEPITRTNLIIAATITGTALLLFTLFLWYFCVLRLRRRGRPPLSLCSIFLLRLWRLWHHWKPRSVWSRWCCWRPWKGTPRQRKTFSAATPEKPPDPPLRPMVLQPEVTDDYKKNEFTIGGVLVIDGAPFGLTTGHSVAETGIPQPSRDQAPTGKHSDGTSQPSTSFSLLAKISSADSSDFGSAIFHSNSTASLTETPRMIDEVILASSSQNLHNHSTTHASGATPFEPTPVLEHSQDIQYSFQLKSSYRKCRDQQNTPLAKKEQEFTKSRLAGYQSASALDWALIDMEKPKSWENVSAANLRVSHVVDHSSLTDGAVWVATEKGIRSGWLRACSVLMNFGGPSFEAFQIIFEEPLSEFQLHQK